MSTYRLFPSTNGPASPVSYGSGTYGSGNFISGMVFTLKETVWFEGYWWWVAASGQSTAPVKCALWSPSIIPTAAGTNAVVSGSVVTSGTLTAGQWNWIPLSTPIPLSAGYNSNTQMSSPYIAAIGCNGNFPDTNGFWTSPIDNGPLHAYEYANGNGGAGSPSDQLPQGVFSTAGSDPSATMPQNASGTDNFWVDVQISDTAPANYSGTSRIWPNKTDASPQTGSDSNVAYVIATEVDFSEEVTLVNAWYFVPSSASAAAGLATKVDLWNISTGLSVASITSPAWTTASGGATPTLGTNTGFWAKAAFPANTTVPAGNYRISVYNSNGANGAWGAKDATSGYWSTGTGANGLAMGPISAPNQASAQSATYYPGSGTGTTGGQPVFAYSGSDVFPSFTTGTNPAQNYWVDVEVQPASQSFSGSGTAAVTFGASATGIKVITEPVSAGLALAGSASGTKRVVVATSAPLSFAGAVSGAKRIVKAVSALITFGATGTSSVTPELDEYLLGGSVSSPLFSGSISVNSFGGTVE